MSASGAPCLEVPSGDGASGNPRKRRRTAVACTSCRVRKSRCNGDVPCSLCDELGIECVYEQPKDSTRQSGAATSAAGPGTDRLTAIEQKLDRLLDLQSLHVTNSSDPDHGHLENGFLASSDHIGDASPEQQEILDGLATIDLNPGSGDNNLYFGPSSSITFVRTLFSAVGALGRSVKRTQAEKDAKSSSSIKRHRASSPKKPARNPQLHPLALPSQDHVPILLDHYFETIAMIFPILDRGYVMSTYSSGRTQGFRRSFLALLNAILAMAVSEPPLPSAIPASSLDDIPDPETFFSRAEHLISRLTQTQKDLDSVQCLLIMATARQAQRNSESMMPSFSHTVSIALQMGLHSPSTYLSLPPRQRESRLRTWWQIINFDRVLSMTFGRPPMLPAQYVIVDLPRAGILNSTLSKGAEQEPQTPPEGNFFVEATKLYVLLHNIISNVYDNNMVRPSIVQASKTFPAVLENESLFKDWNVQLPPFLQLRPWERTTASPRNPSCLTSGTSPERMSVILRLRYLNLRLLNHRSILRAYLERIESSKPIPSLSSTDEDEIFYRDIAPQSLSVIRDCASEVITIVYALNSTPRVLGAWWFAAYYTFHSCLTLYGVMIVSLAGQVSDTKGLFHSDVIQRQIERGMEAMEKICRNADMLERIRRTLGRIKRGWKAFVSSQSMTVQQSSGPLSENSSAGERMDDHAAAAARQVDGRSQHTSSAHTSPFDKLDLDSLQDWTISDLYLFIDLGDLI